MAALLATEHRLPSSSCLRNTRLLANTLSAIPGQALPASFQPDLWWPPSVIAVEGSRKTSPALCKKSPICCCGLQVPVPRLAEKLLCCVAVKLQPHLSDLNHFPCLHHSKKSCRDPDVLVLQGIPQPIPTSSTGVTCSASHLTILSEFLE